MKMDFPTWLKEYLNENKLPGKEAHKRMTHAGRILPDIMPNNAKQSAVLILLFPDSQNDINIVLIQRAIDNSSHSGQIAFPGGKFEEQDSTLWQTALRESNEEINLNTSVDYLGSLSPVYIPVSNFNLYPFVGYCTSKPHLTPSDYEVAAIYTLPLDELYTATVKRKVSITNPMPAYLDVMTYSLEDKFVWGATAMVLAELEDIYNMWKRAN